MARRRLSSLSTSDLRNVIAVDNTDTLVKHVKSEKLCLDCGKPKNKTDKKCLNSNRSMTAVDQVSVHSNEYDVLCIQDPFVLPVGKVGGIPKGATAYHSQTQARSVVFFMTKTVRRWRSWLRGTLSRCSWISAMRSK